MFHRPRALWAPMVCLLSACSSCAERPSPEPVEERAPIGPRAEESCSDGVFGIAEYDALLEPSVDGEPLLYATDPARWIARPEARDLAQRLAAAADQDPAPLRFEARVALQNDVWGLWHRLDQLEASSSLAEALRDGAARLVRILALSRPPGPSVPDDLPARALSRHTPAAVRTILPDASGWRAMATELPVLSHERFFGLRRLFGLRVRDNERALFSRLVALGPGGEPWVTEIVGELEVLTFEGERLVRARVFELDRRGLRCGGSGLVELDRVDRVPSRGADGFLARMDPAEPLSGLPCVRCHDDAEAMSLPAPQLDLGWREPALLEQIRARADRLDFVPPR